MSMSVRAGFVAIAAVVLGIGLAGCGSGSESTEETTTTSEAPTTSAQAAPERNYTIADYIRDNAIVETPVQRGTPGAPTVNLPVPPGWADAGQATPQGAYGAIVGADPAFGPQPPTIIALMSKLTGNVDPAKILEFAAGEIRNLPEYDGAPSGTPSKLSGFDATQVGGTYVKDGVKRATAQKTVVIPGQDGLYVLQLNAEGLEEQLPAMIEATTIIDQQATITP